MSSSIRNYSRCSVLLQAYETRTGRKLWEKEYFKEYEYKNWERKAVTKPRYSDVLVLQLLAEVVEEAVYDPELILAIGRQRN